MDSIKQIAITGSAVGDFMSAGSRKTRRGKRAMHSAVDGDDPAPVGNSRFNIVKTGMTNAQSIPTAAIARPSIVTMPIVTPSNVQHNTAAHTTQDNMPHNAVTTPIIVNTQQGGKQKIILAPKQKTKKVVLAAKHQQKHYLPHKKTHKQTIRRVCLPVNVIKTKIAKTRKHIKDSQSMSIDKIRKELIASKLLNPASKAPDTLLRKIYADLKIIGTN